jgi:hypothetical protein
MAIHRLLKDNAAFGPDEIRLMTTCYEDILRRLRLADRSDPVTEMIAKTIIDLTHGGERDPGKLCKRVLRVLSLSEPP